MTRSASSPSGATTSSDGSGTAPGPSSKTLAPTSAASICAGIALEDGHLRVAPTLGYERIGSAPTYLRDQSAGGRIELDRRPFEFAALRRRGAAPLRARRARVSGAHDRVGRSDPDHLPRSDAERRALRRARVVSVMAPRYRRASLQRRKRVRAPRPSLHVTGARRSRRPHRSAWTRLHAARRELRAFLEDR